MRKGNRFLALLLACMMLCSLLVACGKGNDGSDKDDNKRNTVPTVSTNPTILTSPTVSTSPTVPTSPTVSTSPTVPTSPTISTPPTLPSIPDHDHQWSDWEITGEATCYEEGVRIRNCACGETETQFTPKTAHTEGDWVTISRPTATTQGEQALLCAVCGGQMQVKPLEGSAEWTYKTDDAGYCSGFARVNGDSHDVIFDSFGDVVYTAADSETIEIYANGYFISRGDGSPCLKKADGTVVCSAESLGITGFGLTENYEDYIRFLYDGYVLAYKITNTYNGTQFQIGILGTDGQWIVPLSADHPIISSGADYSAKTLSQHSYIYAGDGILILPVYNAAYSYKLYNIKDNAVYDIVPDVADWNLDYYISIASFKNGVAHVTSGDKLYIVYANGSVINTWLPVTKKGFYADEDGTRYTFGQSAIYINDELHKELDFTVTGAVWVGDSWLVRIKNPAGVYYYTYVTMDGEFLFEPIATNAVYICDVSGVGVGNNRGEGTKVVVNAQGDILYSSASKDGNIYVNKGAVYEEVKHAFSSDRTYTFLSDN
ncbi:MAG: hypothetical protein IJV82_04495 [Oscillospiraceae bacterium]|nr:hypothetical protein [Oscillospiraceae bacterium]